MAHSSRLADIKAGFLVFLIALPLCLGISLASGFPPFAGVLTAIIGGLLASPFMGAQLTIKGPAAGLITIALAAVVELGGGDNVAGYHRALAVGVVAGLVQVVFGLLKAGKLGDFFPSAAVHGMLAAIGVIIFSKQIHVVLGVRPAAKEPLELLAEIPHSVMHMNPAIAVIGGVSIAILFLWPHVPVKAIQKLTIPGPFIVLAFAIPAGRAFDLADEHHYIGKLGDFELGPNFLVAVPSHLSELFATPDFSALAHGPAWKYVLMYALVGSLESLLTAKAIDAVSRPKVPSDLNRDQLAVGLANTVSSFLGGLPMISEIVRSKANLDAGAKSRWANFAHGAFLLLCVAFIPGVVHLIPLAALGAMLVYTGLRLASPKEFAHMLHIGRDQFAVFLATLVVTLATDLLVGIAAGVAFELLIHVRLGARLRSIFTVTATEHALADGAVRLAVSSHATFANYLSLRQRIDRVPSEQALIVDFSGAPLVDHSVFVRLTERRSLRAGGLVVQGLDGLEPISEHPEATRRRRTERSPAGAGALHA